MSAYADRSPVISRIRAEVPEFEEVFQWYLEDEDRELGSFQAMSIFAEWVIQRLRVDPGSAAVQSSFAAVENIASSSPRMGTELLVEFMEAIAGTPQALSHLGPASRMFWIG